VFGDIIKENVPLKMLENTNKRILRSLGHSKDSMLGDKFLY
jgi:hypothetical protein